MACLSVVQALCNLIVCEIICSGVAQTCHDDRVVELKEQLGVEEEHGEGQEEKVKEEGRVKENAP